MTSRDDSDGFTIGMSVTDAIVWAPPPPSFPLSLPPSPALPDHFPIVCSGSISSHARLSGWDNPSYKVLRVMNRGIRPKGAISKGTQKWTGQGFRGGRKESRSGNWDEGGEKVCAHKVVNQGPLT